MVDPELYAARGRRRTQEFEATGADRLVSACVTCGYALSHQMQRGTVLNYLELVFDMPVDWDQVRTNQELMWYGEQGEWAIEKLSTARCFICLDQNDIGDADPSARLIEYAQYSEMNTLS